MLVSVQLQALWAVLDLNPQKWDKGGQGSTNETLWVKEWVLREREPTGDQPDTSSPKLTVILNNPSRVDSSLTNSSD